MFILIFHSHCLYVHFYDDMEASLLVISISYETKKKKNKLDVHPTMYKEDIEYQYPLDIKNYFGICSKNEKFLFYIFLIGYYCSLFYCVFYWLCPVPCIENPFNSHTYLFLSLCFCINYCEILFHMILSLTWVLNVMSFEDHFVIWSSIEFGQNWEKVVDLRQIYLKRTDSN